MMSARRAILNKVGGYPGFNFFRHIYVKNTTGNPSASGWPIGSLCWNPVDGNAFICTVKGSGTWVKINA